MKAETTNTYAMIKDLEIRLNVLYKLYDEQEDKIRKMKQAMREL